MRRTLVPLAVIVVALSALAVVVVWGFTGQPAATTPPAANPSSATSPASIDPPASPTNPTTPAEPTDKSGDPGPNDANPDGTPYSQTAAARQQWQPVAERFATNFTRTAGVTADDWQARLAPDVTKDVQDQLATVDPRNVPAGRYDSLQPVQYDEYQVAVRTDYCEGWSLVLSIISEGDRWKVYRYNRFEQ